MRRRHAANVLALAVADALVRDAVANVTPRELPPELQTELPEARLHGSAKLRFLGLTIYDVRLWSAERPAPSRWADLPLALELEYARALGGGAIAERSIAEMRRQEPIAEVQAERWLAALRRSFPDVTPGDRLTGVLLPGRGVRFFHNGRARGEVSDADFARRFFGIWLAPETSEPALRRQLLGAGG